MTPEDLRALRKTTGLTQRDLAKELALDVELVREWERGEKFPTKAHCAQMERLRDAKPKPKKPPSTPWSALADPEFPALLRKLLAHEPLRAELTRLAKDYPDPSAEESPGNA